MLFYTITSTFLRHNFKLKYSDLMNNIVLAYYVCKLVLTSKDIYYRIFFLNPLCIHKWDTFPYFIVLGGYTRINRVHSNKLSSFLAYFTTRVSSGENVHFKEISS